MKKLFLFFVFIVSFSISTGFAASTYSIVETKVVNNKTAYYFDGQLVTLGGIQKAVYAKAQKNNIDPKALVTLIVIFDQDTPFKAMTNLDGFLDKLGGYNVHYFLSSREGGSLSEVSIKYNGLSRDKLDDFMKQKNNSNPIE